MSEDKTVLSKKHQALLEELCGHENLDSLEYAKSNPDFVLDELFKKLLEQIKYPYKYGTHTDDALRFSISKPYLRGTMREHEEAKAKKAA